MSDDAFGRMVAGIGPRRVVVLSDRYPPDVAGGAEVSLHLLLRQPVLRDQALVVTFDKAIGDPVWRAVDGVDVLALPAAAAWPLHRLSQHAVERVKSLPFAKRWVVFLREALGCAIRSPGANAPALAYRLLGGGVRGGVRMDHVTTPEEPTAPRFNAVLDAVRPRLVHADNARSILIAAAVLRDRAEPLLGFVRDHRFTRVDFDQTAAGSAQVPPGAAERLAAACAEAALGFRRSALDRAAVILVTSAYLASTLADVVGPRRLRRLPLEPVESPTESAPCPHEDFRILIVGSLTPKKGQAELLRAFPEIVAGIPNAVIDVVGQGEQRAEIEAIATRHGAGARIRLHGQLDQAALARLYGACDVVAAPTLWSEPFGRVPIEAGAAGKPVVAYASGGLAETIVDSVTGRMIPTGDVAAFIGALAELAADPAQRARMGEAGRVRARENFAPETLAGQLAEIWDATIATAAGARGS